MGTAANRDSWTQSQEWKGTQAPRQTQPGTAAEGRGATRLASNRTGENPPYGMIRGGGGNEVDGLMTFCHDARKGRYMGSHWPNHVAPPLHSTSVPVDKHQRLREFDSKDVSPNARLKTTCQSRTKRGRSMRLSCPERPLAGQCGQRLTHPRSAQYGRAREKQVPAISINTSARCGQSRSPRR